MAVNPSYCRRRRMTIVDVTDLLSVAGSPFTTTSTSFQRALTLGGIPTPATSMYVLFTGVITTAVTGLDTYVEASMGGKKVRPALCQTARPLRNRASTDNIPWAFLHKRTAADGKYNGNKVNIEIKSGTGGSTVGIANTTITVFDESDILGACYFDGPSANNAHGSTTYTARATASAANAARKHLSIGCGVFNRDSTVAVKAQFYDATIPANQLAEQIIDPIATNKIYGFFSHKYEHIPAPSVTNDYRMDFATTTAFKNVESEDASVLMIDMEQAVAPWQIKGSTKLKGSTNLRP